MPTVITSPSNANTKVRYNEQYVSAGLNQKTVGPIPNGIIRGGKMVTTGAGLNVQIEPDPNTGDSVYTYTTPTGFQLTHRESGIRVLDLTAVVSTEIYVCLFIQYSIGSPTVVEWRTYTFAELFGGAPVAEAGSVVIVGKVDVPGAGPIPASNVTPDARREAWKDESAGMRPWNQIVQNGTFTAGGLGFVSGSGSTMPGFTGTQEADSQITQDTLSGDVETPRTGGRSLRYESSGVSNVATVGPGQFELGEPYSAGWIPVKAGQLVDVSFYLAGESVEAYTQDTHGMRLILLFHDTTGAQIAAPQVASDPATEIGTFTWKYMGGIFEAPQDGVLQWYIDFRIDQGLQTGKFFVDDLRIFLQPSITTQENAGQEEVYIHPSLRASEVGISPRKVNNQNDLNRYSARIINEVRTGTPFNSLLTLIAGDGLSIPEWLTPYISSAKDIPDGAYGVMGARFGPQDETVPTAYKLLQRYKLSNDLDARVYSCDDGVADEALAVTVNAWWEGNGVDEWNKDDSSNASSKFTFVTGRIGLQRKNGGINDWADNDWDREQELLPNDDGDIVYGNPVRRTKVLDLGWLSSFSNVFASVDETMQLLISGGDFYLAGKNPGASQLLIPLDLIVPNGSELVDVHIGFQQSGGTLGASSSFALSEGAPVVYPTPYSGGTVPLSLIENLDIDAFLGPVPYGDHLRLSTGSMGGLPHMMDFANNTYVCQLVFTYTAVAPLVTYVRVIYDDYGPGGR